MPKSDYLKEQVLNYVLRADATSFTAPTVVYLALFTVAPTDAGGGTEVSGGSYVRVSVTFGAPAGGQVTNTSAVDFPMATGDWGTVVAFALFDAVSGGNMLYWNNLTATREILTNDQARYPAGQLIVTEA
jgi:hypothetical protein